MEFSTWGDQLDPSANLRIPDTYRNADTEFLDLPLAVQSIYLASVKIPKQSPRPGPPPSSLVAELLAFPEATTTDTTTKYAFSDKGPQADRPLFTIPSASVLQELLLARASEWTAGKISVLVVTDRTKASRYPLWALEMWLQVHELEEARTSWKEALRFVSKVVVAQEDTERSGYLAEAQDVLSGCSRNESLFRTKVNSVKGLTA